MGIGSGIAKLGIGAAITSMVWGMLTGRAEAAENSINPLQRAKEYFGEDSFIAKTLKSGSALSALSFIGAYLLPKSFGGLRGAAMSIAGVLTAYGLYKNVLRNDFSGAAGKLADRLDVDFLNRQESNSTTLTPEQRVQEVLRNFETTSAPQPASEAAKLSEIAANPLRGTDAGAEEEARIQGSTQKSAQLLSNIAADPTGKPAVFIPGTAINIIEATAEAAGFSLDPRKASAVVGAQWVPHDAVNGEIIATNARFAADPEKLAEIRQHEPENVNE